ncbi:hypothetical protein Dimus_003237 [Dionaea muscipula]
MKSPNRGKRRVNLGLPKPIHALVVGNRRISPPPSTLLPRFSPTRRATILRCRPRRAPADAASRPAAPRRQAAGRRWALSPLSPPSPGLHEEEEDTDSVSPFSIP